MDVVSNKAIKMNFKMKLLLVVMIMIFFLTFLLLVTVEGIGLVDALYFIIITISTVGYGDIVPQYTITKVMLVLLLLLTLTTIAFFSEFVVNRIVYSRFMSSYMLPDNIGQKNHVILARINSVSLELAQLAKHRFFDVIMIDTEIDRVEKAREIGIDAFIGNILDPHDLDKLNLPEAQVFFLFQDSNNDLLKSAIMIRAKCTSILIYAQTVERQIKQEFAELLGISRLYSAERILGSFISVSTRNLDVTIFANEPERTSDFYYAVVRVRDEKELLDIFPEHYILGLVSNLNGKFINIFTTEYHKMIDNIPNYKNNIPFRYLLIYPKYLESEKDYSSYTITGEDIALDSRYSQIIILGYNKFTAEILKNLRVEKSHFLIITYDETEAEDAIKEDFKVKYLKDRDLLADYLKENISDNDVVYNFQDSLDDAVISNVTINKIHPEVPIFQLSSDPYEHKVFTSLGVKGILDPDFLVVRAMFQIFLKSNNYPASNNSFTSHLFECTIDSEHDFLGYTIDRMIKEGYTPVYIKEKDEDLLVYYKEKNNKYRVKIDDTIIFHVNIK